jgi:hypothetical protein
MKVGSQAQPRDLATFACGHDDSALRPRPAGIAVERSHRATTSQCPFVARPAVSVLLLLFRVRLGSPARPPESRRHLRRPDRDGRPRSDVWLSGTGRHGH